jgi:hypothetical protein
MKFNYIYIFLALILFNSIYLTFLYTRVKKNISNSVIEEVQKCEDEILIFPEVISIRGKMAEYGEIRQDGIIYLTSKEIIFHNLTKKKKIIIPVQMIKKIDQAKEFMGSVRKNKNICLLKLADGNTMGIFVADNKLWETKIKKAKKMN